MDRRNEGEALSVTRYLPAQAQASRAQAPPHSGGWGVFGVNGLGLALRGSSNNTLIKVLGMLPPALDLHVDDQSLPD